MNAGSEASMAFLYHLLLTGCSLEEEPTHQQRAAEQHIDPPSLLQLHGDRAAGMEGTGNVQRLPFIIFYAPLHHFCYRLSGFIYSWSGFFSSITSKHLCANSKTASGRVAAHLHRASLGIRTAADRGKGPAGLWSLVIGRAHFRLFCGIKATQQRASLPFPSILGSLKVLLRKHLTYFPSTYIYILAHWLAKVPFPALGRCRHPPQSYGRAGLLHARGDHVSGRAQSCPQHSFLPSASLWLCPHQQAHGRGSTPQLISAHQL